MKYKVIIVKQAEKDIRKIQTFLAKNIFKKIYALADDPRPAGHKKMTDFQSDRAPGEDCYRIRVGGNRVIYTIKDDIITVTVIQVKKRGDIY